MTLTVAGLVVAVVAAVLAAAGIAAGAVWFLSGRIDSSRAEVLTQVRHLDTKNEKAHEGIVARADRHAAKLDTVARDVAYLAGQQAERDRRDGA